MIDVFMINLWFFIFAKSNDLFLFVLFLKIPWFQKPCNMSKTKAVLFSKLFVWAPEIFAKTKLYSLIFCMKFISFDRI